jgi:hypothetical protein
VHGHKIEYMIFPSQLNTGRPTDFDPANGRLGRPIFILNVGWVAAPPGSGSVAIARRNLGGPKVGTKAGMHRVGEKNNSFLSETLSKLHFFGTS